jgi:trehalose 6-phosphate phosphatase
LAPIVDHPDAVGPDSLRNNLLSQLQVALNGRLAVVSGRPIIDIDRILEGRIPCVAGVHGLELRNGSGFTKTAAAHPQLTRVHEVANSFGAAHPDLFVEFKDLSVALHYRQAPHLAAQVLRFGRRLAWATGMKLQEGRMVVELRSPGPDKGDTVRAFLQEPEFRGTTPIFLGDDVTDEDGFAAAEALSGVGVLIGPQRETNASSRLKDVAHVLAWIQNALLTDVFELDVFRKQS